MAFLFFGAGPVCRRALEQDRHLHVACGVAARALVEEPTSAGGRHSSVAAVFCDWRLAWLADGAGGKVPRRRSRGGVVFDVCGPVPGGGTGVVVLCWQAGVAVAVDFHLSALANQCRHLVAMGFSDGGRGRFDGAMVFAKSD